MIENREQFDAALTRVGVLSRKGQNRTPEETKLFRLLLLLIRDYDSRHMLPDTGDNDVRDPRVDPKPKDIIRIGGVYGGKFYEVLDHDPRLATSDVSFVKDGKERAFSIDNWRLLMQDAEIIRAAD